MVIFCFNKIEVIANALLKCVGYSFLFFLLRGFCYAGDLYNKEVNFCDVVHNYSFYENNNVNTVAYLHQTKHGFMMYSKKCPKEFIEVVYSKDTYIDKSVDSVMLYAVEERKKAELYNKDYSMELLVTVSGVFLTYDKGVYGWSHLNRFIELYSITKAVLSE